AEGGTAPRPAQPEAHEVLCGDRLDLTPQTLLRIAVNAQQQAARAPLPSRQRWIEVAPKREALGFEPRERDRHRARRERALGGEQLGGHRSEQLQMTAQRRRGDALCFEVAAATAG